MATLKDVAKLTNVDISTVSRALNNTSYVHPDTKKKIFAAVEQLSYKPNLLTKGLHQGKHQTIGVVVPSINLNVFGEIVQEIEIRARKLGYSILICNTQDRPDVEEECLTRLRNGLVDGIIIASTGQNGRMLRNIKSDGLSVVQMVRMQDKNFSSVVANYYASGYKGVKYLASRGCLHIGFVGAIEFLVPYKERYRGYSKAIKELKYQEYRVNFEVGSDDEGYFQNGYAAVGQLLQMQPKLDGIMVATDMQGLGVIRALNEAGISVPGQIRVMSLTGHSIGGMLETTITSMEMPAKDMGRRLVEMIIEDIEAKPGEKPSTQHVVFDTTLVEREST